MDIQTKVILGKDLTREELDIINKYRDIEFNSKTPISPSRDNADWEKPYFLVYAGDNFVSFGRLHFLTVEFRHKRYPILGIATIVSVEKGKGYGKVLMQRIKEYIQDSGKTAIGFCNPKNSPFYQKAGYNILVGGVARFEYHNENGEIVDGLPGDVIYINGKDNLISEILDNTSEKVHAFRPQW